MIKYILFDLDGTLNDSGDGIRKALRYALAKFKIVENKEANLNRMIGPPLVDGFMQFYGLSHSDAVKGRSYYREYYDEKGKFECEIYAGIKELVSSLKRLNIALGVCTSKPTKYSKEVLEHIQIAPYFSFLEGASLDGKIAEKEQIIALALKRYNINPSAAVMVGDRKFDVLGAKVNGVKSIGVCYGFGSRQELADAGVDYLVDSVQELRELLFNMCK